MVTLANADQTSELVSYTAESCRKAFRVACEGIHATDSTDLRLDDGAGEVGVLGWYDDGLRLVVDSEVDERSSYISTIVSSKTESRDSCHSLLRLYLGQS